MTRAELNKRYNDLMAEYEQKLAIGVDDEELYEEIEELNSELLYRAEADRF